MYQTVKLCGVLPPETKCHQTILQNFDKLQCGEINSQYKLTWTYFIS